jgi:hypothetical protein
LEDLRECYAVAIAGTANAKVKATKAANASKAKGHKGKGQTKATAKKPKINGTPKLQPSLARFGKVTRKTHLELVQRVLFRWQAANGFPATGIPPPGLEACTHQTIAYIITAHEISMMSQLEAGLPVSILDGVQLRPMRQIRTFRASAAKRVSTRCFRA